MDNYVIYLKLMPGSKFLNFRDNIFKFQIVVILYFRNYNSIPFNISLGILMYKAL